MGLRSRASAESGLPATRGKVPDAQVSYFGCCTQHARQSSVRKDPGWGHREQSVGRALAQTWDPLDL